MCTEQQKNRIKEKAIINIVSVIGLVVTLMYIGYLWKLGVLTDADKMNAYISKLGPMGILVFVAIQIVLVVIPVIPGGISCVVGVAVYGALRGLLFNYIGICIGSMIAFGISKRWGRAVLNKLFSTEKIEKYDDWLKRRSKLNVAFALLILSPVAPDDLLCYLAGTTKMRFRCFAPIILLCKPLPIFLYSMGLNAILQAVVRNVG